MVLIIILLLILVIGLAFRNKLSAKNLFQPKQKFYSIDDEYNAKQKEKQNEIDRLLDKIGPNGLDDLTEKERKRLDELSKK